MSEKPNILFIVEGERLEPEVINRMAEVYGLRCDISSVCTNIHILYNQMIAPRPQDMDGEIVMFQHLSGLLKSYRRIRCKAV